MSDIQQLLPAAETALPFIFGDNPPARVMLIGAAVFLALLALAVLRWTLLLLGQLRRLAAEYVLPLFYSRAQRRRRRNRQRYVTHVIQQLQQANADTYWEDDRYVELEAEVDSQGVPAAGRWSPTRLWQRGPRRVRALTRAMAASRESWILLQGDPGSGKSVALRHLSLQLARRAQASRRVDSVIPVYINLKELARQQAAAAAPATVISPGALGDGLVQTFGSGDLQSLYADFNLAFDQLSLGGTDERARALVEHLQQRQLLPRLLAKVQQLRPAVDWQRLVTADAPAAAVDRQIIDGFVRRALNPTADPGAAAILEQEYEAGLRAGTWLFLFDSFDELPAVLSATREDDRIRSYTDAIHAFIQQVNNRCRAVVASRAFRAPDVVQPRWIRFRIAPLTPDQRQRLIRRTGLDRPQRAALLGHLATAGPGLQSMARNPLLLSLLCQHVQSGAALPESAHQVFEHWIDGTLRRQAEGLQRSFQLTAADVRPVAEEVAFAMAADETLGLSPTRAALADSLDRDQTMAPPDMAHHLDALEWLQLARSRRDTPKDTTPTFSFVHRRLQEYFATCAVLRRPERVAPVQLLTDGRWRETAVTLCQTAPSAAALAPLLAAARSLLAQAAAQVPDLMQPGDRVSLVLSQQIELQQQEAALDPGQLGLETPAASTLPREATTLFAWPASPDVLHLLDLLQSGFGDRLPDLPGDIREQAADLLVTAAARHTVLDRRWALEVAGILPQPALSWMLRDAFASRSRWLREAAFNQAARLPVTPPDMAQAIRRTLLGLLVSGRLHRDRTQIRAHLARFDQAPELSQTLQLLEWTPWLDRLAHALLLVVWLGLLASFGTPVAELVSFLGFVGIYFGLSHLGLRWIAYLPYVGLRLGEIFAPAAQLLHGALLFVGAYIRFTIPFLLGFILGPNIGARPATGLAVLAAYLVLWAPGALFMAARGALVAPGYWPLLPLWPLVLLEDLVRRGTGRWASRVRAFVGDNPMPALAMGLFLLAVVGVIVVLGWLEERFVPVQQAGTICAWGAILLVLLQPARRLLLWLLDWFRWQRWARPYRLRDMSLAAVERRRAVLSPPAFRAAFSQFRTAEFRTRLVRIVRQHGMLDAGAGEAVSVLLPLVQEYSPDQEGGKAATADLGDELARLLAQVRAGPPGA